LGPSLTSRGSATLTSSSSHGPTAHLGDPTLKTEDVSVYHGGDLDDAFAALLSLA